MVAMLPCLLLFVALSAHAAPDLLIETELEPERVHVLSQAVYRVRFLHAVDVSGVELGGPSAQAADFREIGSRVGEAVRDGRRYRVHERSYAVFPFASGALLLSGGQAGGLLPSAAGGRKVVRIEAPPRLLTVLPALEGDWLPARSLKLEESWAPAFGATQRRTIRVEAAGVDAAQLPAVVLDIPGVTVQPEPPRFRNRFKGELNIGTREQGFLLLPEGKVTVPELQLHWWNVEEGSFAVASLPAHVLRAERGGIAPANMSLLPWILAALLCALAGLLVHRLLPRLRLRHACLQTDLHRVRGGLLAWSAGIWPQPPRTLGMLAGHMRDPAVRNVLNEMERALYGPSAKKWKACELLALVRAVQREGRRKAGMMNAVRRCAGMTEETS
jgi:hypothetical protein